jgi:hypothetical protein
MIIYGDVYRWLYVGIHFDGQGDVFIGRYMGE